jgi:Zn-dependent protease with chaperone function
MRDHLAGITHRLFAALTLVTLCLAPAVVTAQTRVTAPPNKYTPQQDVQLGNEAAAQVRQKMPLVGDQQVQTYVSEIGRRLVAAIPPEFQHPEFHYTFQVVDAKDENAFALPGGSMFICRGMVEGVKNDGELAGVLAHELSHVSLRHGTAQATRATPYEIGAIAGQILGGILGGTAGQVISTGSQFGISTAFLRFSREYEKQADLLGSHIMARAGYDPRDMAAVFQMLEQQGGPGAPEWLSDHPNPGNRVAYITAEAKNLQVTNALHSTGELPTVQTDLRSLPPAQTMAQLEKDAQNGNPQGNRTIGGNAGGSQPVGTTGSFPATSTSYRTYNQPGVFRVNVPDNWQAVSGNNSVRFSPEGASGQANGQQAFLLGVEVGLAGLQAADLQSASQQFVQQLTAVNPNLRPQSDFQSTTLDGRQALRMAFNNTNDAGQPETVVLQTTLLDDGNLFYALDVAPSNQFATYQPVFRRVGGSIRLTGR